MSYDVLLLDEEGSVVQMPEKIEEGGMRALGGSSDCALYITYNYGEVYRIFDFSISDLDGKKARDTMEKMQSILDKIDTKEYKSDYWAPTPGNAARALKILLMFARGYPDGVWKVY